MKGFDDGNSKPFFTSAFEGADEEALVPKVKALSPNDELLETGSLEIEVDDFESIFPPNVKLLDENFDEFSFSFS